MKTNFVGPTDEEVANAVEIQARHHVAQAVGYLESSEEFVCKLGLRETIENFEAEDMIPDSMIELVHEIIDGLDVPEDDPNPSVVGLQATKTYYVVEWLDELGTWSQLTSPDDSGDDRRLEFDEPMWAQKQGAIACDTRYRVVRIEEKTSVIEEFEPTNPRKEKF